LTFAATSALLDRAAAGPYDSPPVPPGHPMKFRSSHVAVLAAVFLLSGCTGLGRRVNQALPEFMRGEPGKEERERIQTLQTRLEAPPGASAARTQAFESAKRAYDNCRFDDAASLFEDFIDDYPSSEYDEEARYLWGESHYRDNDYSNAFSAYKAYAEAYPVSNRAPEIEERVYTMGCCYLSGKRKTFFGMFSNKGVGEEMFIWLVQTYPNAARADDAQWNLSRYYVCDQEWPKATAAFDFLVKQYPTSEWLPAAKYYTGYTRYRQVKGTRYDQTIVRESRKRFAAYVEEYPDGQWRAEAERLICILDNIAAEKLLNIAQWYITQGKRWSARYYLVRLETLYPSSNAACRGRAILAGLPITPPCPGEYAEVVTRVAVEEGDVGAESRPVVVPESAPVLPQ
jgi:outer membrane protein assembly factor BamD (BamD/ComL family)